MRLAVALTITAFHVALVISMWELRRPAPPRPAPARDDSLEIFFVARTAEPPPPIAPRREERRRAAPATAPSARDLSESEQQQPESSAITIDWAAEAQGAAERFAAADEESRRQQMAFAPRAPAAKTAPGFAWSHSRTHRIERTEDGMTLFWISERCALLNFLIPVCQFGKTEPNGELFEQMNKPAELGDWKDP